MASPALVSPAPWKLAQASTTPAATGSPTLRPSASAAGSDSPPTIVPARIDGGTRPAGMPAAASTSASGLGWPATRLVAARPVRRSVANSQVARYAGRGRGRIRFVSLQPQRGRQAAERPALEPRDGGQLVLLGPCPGVVPDDRRPRWPPGRVDGHERRSVAVHGDGRDLGDIVPAQLADGGHDRARTRPPDPARPDRLQDRRRWRSPPWPARAAGRRGSTRPAFTSVVPRSMPRMASSRAPPGPVMPRDPGRARRGRSRRRSRAS